jgi:hypothetical protein
MLAFPVLATLSNILSENASTVGVFIANNDLKSSLGLFSMAHSKNSSVRFSLSVLFDRKYDANSVNWCQGELFEG